MICPKCGNQMKDGAKFCNKCGTELEQQTKNEVATPESVEEHGEEVLEPGLSEEIEPLEAPAEGEAPAEDETPAQDEASEQNRSEGSDKKKSPIKIVIAIVAVIVLAVAGVAIFNYVQEQNRIAEEARIAAEAEAAAQAAIDAVDETRLKEDVLADANVMAGAASKNFVDVPKYELKSIALTNKDVSEDEIKMNFDFELENEFFSQKSKGVATYGLVDDEWVSRGIVVGESNITPLRGISKTDGGPVAKDKVTFDAKAKTSKVNVTLDKDTWYGKVTGDVVETYKFDGLAWKLESTEGEKRVTGLDKLAGSFYDERSKKTDTPHYLHFEIKDVNGETGECTVSYKWQSEILFRNAGRDYTDVQQDSVPGTIKVNDDGTVTMNFGAFTNHPDPIQGNVTFLENGDIKVFAKVYTQKWNGKTNSYGMMDIYDISVDDPISGTVTLVR